MLTTPQYIIDIALNAKDEIFLLINSGNLVKLEKAGIQSNSDGTVLVADENAIDVYKFDSTGKILSTIDSIHGSEILKYNYTANGDLESISDVDGQSTTITHDGSGRVQSISSPYGETTRLSYDADGLLAAIVDPASRALSYEYDDQGLLTRSTDARGNASNYDYNSQGLLISDTDAAGFKKTYSRNTDVSHNEIEAKSPMGRVRKFTSRVSADGVLFRKFTAPDGSFTSSIQDAKHNSNLVSTTGEHFDSVSQVDPRFGLGSSIPMSVSKTTPEGVKAEANFARSITLQNNSDFLSLNTLTDETSYPGLGKLRQLTIGQLGL
jgi:YD repeat-containing protein